MREYDRFEKGAANSNKSTRVLQKQLEDPAANIIITTIQKLDVFISKNKKHDVYKKHVVIIFDECPSLPIWQYASADHETFQAISFVRLLAHRFLLNSRSGGNPLFKTTEQAFGDKLHTYTIVNAISDANVLFRTSYSHLASKVLLSIITTRETVLV